MEMALTPLFVNFPAYISPEIIPGLPFRWYGLMYIFAFATAYLLYRHLIRERRFPMSDDDLSGLFFWGICALLVGARLFSTLVYERSPEQNIYLHKPWLIFWPFQDGRFTGLQGMSYHGGVIGGIIGFVVYARVKRFNIREIADMWACTIPAGYTFGRLGNFLNQELYGRVTSSPLGMLFPTAEPFPASLEWVRETATRAGISLPVDPNALVNLPRFPSQLFEAVFEGIVLWSVLWMIRKHSPFKGFLAGAYIFGYGFIRFILEYFREPDAGLGYRIQLGQQISLADIAHLHPLTSFSTGQILCAGMMAVAVVYWLIVSRFPDAAPAYYYPATPTNSTPKSVAKNARRNAKRKLR
jgi:phosphatidylglycerol:prolipoprotein diacylglycerol transferase